VALAFGFRNPKPTERAEWNCPRDRRQSGTAIGRFRCTL
jgi:hypothetical protein